MPCGTECDHVAMSPDETTVPNTQREAKHELNFGVACEIIVVCWGRIVGKDVGRINLGSVR